MKTCLLLVTTNISETLYNRYLLLKDMELYDVYILCDTFKSSKESLTQFNDDHIIYFNSTVLSVYNKMNYIYPYVGTIQFISLWFYTYKNSSYDYYWFMEDDIILEGDRYKEFFEKTNKIDADLLCYQIQTNEDWYWNKRFIRQFTYKKFMYTLLQLHRLSNRAVKNLSNYQKADHIHTECLIPSITYDAGYIIKEYNKELPEYNYHITTKKTLEYLSNRKDNEWYHPVKISQENKHE